MLQLLVVYFGPYFIFGMRLTPNSQNLAVIIGFTLNYAAVLRGDLPQRH